MPDRNAFNIQVVAMDFPGADMTSWHKPALEFLLFFLLIFSTVIFVGCSTDRVVLSSREGISNYWDWLRDGQTTRGDIEDRFGWPVSCYENKKIMSYLLYETRDGQYTNVYGGRHAVGNPDIYSLILVFKNDVASQEYGAKTDVVNRHSFVKISKSAMFFDIIKPIIKKPKPCEN